MAAEERRLRIEKLAEWFRQKIEDPRGLIRQQIEAGILNEAYGIDHPAIHRNYEDYYQGMLVSEAKMRWMVSPSTARSYAEMAYLGTLPLLLKNAVASGKTTNGGLFLGHYLRPPSQSVEVLGLREALETLKELEGPMKQPVQRSALLQRLMTKGFTADDAEKVVRKMFREGMIYESKPGFIPKAGRLTRAKIPQAAGSPNPKNPGTETYQSHGVTLDLTTWLADYKETVPLVDEICKRVSILRRSIEEAGIWANEFEQTWETPTEVVIWLSSALKEKAIRRRYWDKRKQELKPGWDRARDPLDSYYIRVGFLKDMDEKGLPRGKLRSMVIWLQNAEADAPVGNLGFVSRHFVF